MDMSDLKVGTLVQDHIDYEDHPSIPARTIGIIIEVVEFDGHEQSPFYRIAWQDGGRILAPHTYFLNAIKVLAT